MGKLIERAVSLLAELRHRRVPHAAGIYLVAAWAVIEVTATIFPLLFISEDAVRIVTLVAVLGFPVALVLSWAYDIGPAGIERAPASEPPIPRSKANAILVALTLLATALVGAAGWALWIEPHTAAGETEPLDPARVAVLYLDDHSEGGHLGYLADGLTEALIHALTQIEPLEVVSRNGVKPYRDPTVPLDSIARALRAGSLVEGSIEGDRERLVVTIQLVDGRTGTDLLSTRIERSGRDYLALRDAIVTEAARLLSRTLGRELELERLRAGTDDAEAWALVKRARSLMDHADTLRWGVGDIDGAGRILNQADSLLARAAEHDRAWPEPKIMRAEVAAQRARSGLQISTAEQTAAIRAGIEQLDAVLRSDPDHAEALALRGAMRIQLSWAPGGEEADAVLRAAEADLRRAVELDPGTAVGWIALADLLRSRGDFAEASVAAEQALAADPFLIHAEQSILFTLAHVWLELEDFERALRWNAEGQRRYPADPGFHAERLVIMATVPEAELDPDSAWALVRAVEAGYGLEEWSHGSLLVAAVLARSGQPDSARAVMKRVLDSHPESPWLDYHEAIVRVQLGEPDVAVDRLSRFLDAMPHRRPYIGRDWLWRPLRGRPRFDALVADS